MKRTVMAVVVAGLLTVAGSALSAQSYRFGIGGGVLMPMGDYNTVDKPGWVAGADATYWLAGTAIGIRVEGSYSQTKHDGVDGNTKIAGGMADVVYAFGGSASQVRPYVLAGIGYYNVKVDVTGFGSASESKVGFGGGAGFAFKMGTGGTRIFVEGKFTSVSTSGSSLNFLPIRAGIRFGS
jgi:hypothetical protein